MTIVELLFTLFLEFFKTGLFSVGGGLATLPFLELMGPKYGWFTVEELTNMIAVAESTPGPIGVNVATYVGFTAGNLGILGAIFATLSLTLPSVIVIVIIAGFLEKFQQNKIVQNVFYGLRAAVVGLLAVSFLSVLRTTFLVPGAESLLQMVDLRKVLLFGVIMFLLFKFKKHPIVYIAIGAVTGIIFGL